VRPRCLAPALLLLPLLAPRAARADGPAPATATAAPLAVEPAIGRGAKALLRLSRHERPPSEGEASLRALALLRSGVSAKDSDLAKALAALTRGAAQGRAEDVYDAALRILVVDSLARERVAQADGGPPYYRARPLAREEAAAMRGAADALAKVGAAGGWGYGLDASFGAVDPRVNESTTQFAVLGLDTAARAGVAVAPGIWAAVRDAHVRAHVRAPGGAEAAPEVDLDPDAWPPDADAGPRHPRWAAPEARFRVGRWFYDPRARAIPRWSGDPKDAWFDPEGLAMTLAGVSSLAIACERAAAEEPDEVGAGLAAVALDLRAAFERWRRRPPARLNYYLLYSLEKAMDRLGLRRIGGVEWYREGAAFVLADQKPDGTFGDGGAIDTALALLFLNRAARLAPPPRVETGAGR
jgi:hypothetical protein